MTFTVTTLGTGAALPARGRMTSAQLVDHEGAQYLIDCGEGTQERLRWSGINFLRIGHVFIGHLHGDHYLGLMGLLSTMHLMGRRMELHVHGPAPLKPIIDIQLEASATWLRYPLHFHALPHASGRLLWSDEHVQVTSLRLEHRLPCTGFVFRERPRPRPLRKDKLHLVPHYRRAAVKGGEDLVLEDGTRIANTELTLESPAPRAYAYCSDTAYEPLLIPHLKDVDLLYHEATFTEQLAQRARETMHSTARQAALIARDAAVGRLLLGHFSSRYKTAEPLLREAREVFPNVIAATDGAVHAVREERP